jgi:hypothetical protein
MIEIKTGKREFDGLWPVVKGFLDADVREIPFEGRIVRGYRSPDCPYIWFRDHIHMMEATVYSEHDIKNAVSFMLDMQQDDGHFYDYITPKGELLRVPTEADVEYLAVIGIYRAWQASGDDDWIAGYLPKLAKGLEYCTSHPWRWDPEHQMVKRAYTIDTWDFDFREDLTEIHWPGKIDEKTHFGIMHGDNSGLYYAWVLMARMLDHLGKSDEAQQYEVKAEGLRNRANELLFNGRFYRHRLPLDDARIPGVNEEEQLSLSNAYNLNRGLPTPEIAASIIEEYISRRNPSKAFAEWYSIDPPFPAGVFGSEKLVPGSYVNGGIMPLVGGELARGAFCYGYSDYGIDILLRYFEMIDRTGESYLWYFPDGKPPTVEESTSPEVLPTDGWGSSAMAAALIEGLAGIEDEGKLFEHVRLCPRWIAAGVDNSGVDVSYAASGAGFWYTFEHDPKEMIIVMRIRPQPSVSLSVLLPKGAADISAKLNGQPLQVKSRDSRDGVYAEMDIAQKPSREVEIAYDIRE